MQQILFVLGLAVFLSNCQSQTTGKTGWHVLENNHLKVQIDPYGAELKSIFDKSTGEEILWIGDSAYWESQSPVMFPVNVRFKDEKYSYKGAEYIMPRMGLAVINTFEIESGSHRKKVIFTFAHTSETKASYPFNFDFKVTYQLVDNQLINRFTISNLGIDTLYFALGGHPGFNCPFDNGLTRTDYEYVFPQELTIDRTVVENSLVQPYALPYLENESRLSLSDKRIPNGGMFLIKHGISEIGVARKGESPFVTVNLGNFPNLNLWSPPGMPFACIEPMVSHHDIADSPLDIEKKSHLISIRSGEMRDYHYILTVP